MKTNFTIPKFFMAAFALVAMVVSSCSEDAPVVVLGAGIYEMGSATMVDGNINDATTTTMVLKNVPAGGQIAPAIEVPAGEANYTTAFVDAVLVGAAPCEGADPTAYTYQINLKDNLNLAFICTSEGDLSEDLGTWKLLDGNTTLSMSVAVSFSPVPIPIVIEDVTITDTAISGTVQSLPMVRYIVYDDGTPMPIGGPIDGDPTNLSPENLNVQYISVNIVLNKVQ